MNDYEPQSATLVHDIALSDHTFVRPTTGRIARRRVFQRMDSQMGGDVLADAATPSAGNVGSLPR